ncbi:MAG: dihydrofolate reductase family protein, partial [Candidatus Dormiibacterota bacterium]
MSAGTVTTERAGLVVVNASISLDGYVAGPHHEMDWVFDHQFLPTTALDVVDMMIASTGAILAGRGSHDVGERSRRAETSSAFGGRWAGPEFVLTHRPPSASPVDGPRYIAGDIREAVDLALRAAGGRNLLVLGAEVA